MGAVAKGHGTVPQEYNLSETTKFLPVDAASQIVCCKRLACDEIETTPSARITK